MTFHRIAITLAAVLIAAPCPPAGAQGPDDLPAKRAAKPGKVGARAPRRAAKPAPAEAGRSTLLGPGSANGDRASSLERRRKDFFAPKPDEGGSAADGSPPRAGVTLGGSNGLTPGMGFSF